MQAGGGAGPLTALSNRPDSAPCRAGETDDRRGIFKATSEKHRNLLFICFEQQARGDFCLLSSPDWSCHVHPLIYVIHACVHAARGSKNTSPERMCLRTSVL